MHGKIGPLVYKNDKGGNLVHVRSTTKGGGHSSAEAVALNRTYKAQRHWQRLGPVERRYWDQHLRRVHVYNNKLRQITEPLGAFISVNTMLLAAQWSMVNTPPPAQRLEFIVQINLEEEEGGGIRVWIQTDPSVIPDLHLCEMYACGPRPETWSPRMQDAKRWGAFEFGLDQEYPAYGYPGRYTFWARLIWPDGSRSSWIRDFIDARWT